MIKDKIDCCGCNACGDTCNCSAITFKTDIEGFWYPEGDNVKALEIDAFKEIIKSKV